MLEALFSHPLPLYFGQCMSALSSFQEEYKIGIAAHVKLLFRDKLILLIISNIKILSDENFTTPCNTAKQSPSIFANMTESPSSERKWKRNGDVDTWAAFVYSTLATPLSRLGQVYRAASPIGTSIDGEMVHLSRVRECYPGFANVE